MMLNQFSFNVFEISRRDLGCLGAAAALHALLLLWTGIPLKHMETDLGEVLIQVQFRSDLPDQQTAAARRQPTKSFASRVKAFFQKKPETSNRDESLAMTQAADKIDVRNDALTDATKKLADKQFNDRAQFSGINKVDEPMMAKGDSLTAKISDLTRAEKIAEPALQEKAYSISPKDSPFKIMKPKSEDALAMANTVPVNVSRKTSVSVKNLDRVSAAPALQAKTFGSDSGLGFAGAAGAKGADGLAGISTGRSSKISSDAALASAAPFAGNVPASGALGRTSSRSGGGAIGGSFSGRSSAVLPSSDEPIAGGGDTGGGDSRFSITGALANRKPLRKTFPAYEMDARVGLRFRVDWSGRVLDGIVIVISSGSPTFDKKVSAALKKWVFSRLPASRSNEIQEGIITFRFKGV